MSKRRNHKTDKFLRHVEWKTGIILDYIKRLGSQNPKVDILRLKWPAAQIKYMERGCMRKVSIIAIAFGFEIEWE